MTTRRGFLASLSALGIATAVDAPARAEVASEPIAFYGRHQAGIATPQQDHLVFAAFDVIAAHHTALPCLLRSWTAAIERMTRGLPVAPTGRPTAVPVDTGEALGLAAARLSVTVGFGPSLFDDRFGLRSRLPAALGDLPPLPPERLDPARCGGDIAVQACADDPVVAFHAVRELARMAHGVARIRWLQSGFLRTGTRDTAQATPRNLLGFKDGTRNIPVGDRAALKQHVWVGAETDQPWMRNGSYAVVRRIRMRLEAWDAETLADQQDVFGRFKVDGAPLSGTRERDTPDFRARRPDGSLVIPRHAHIRLAAPENNGGIRILRRGYSFVERAESGTGRIEAGLFFVAYQKDPRSQFVPLRRRQAADALNEYSEHVGSAVFAMAPGAGDSSDWLGRALLDQRRG